VEITCRKCKQLRETIQFYPYQLKTKYPICKECCKKTITYKHKRSPYYKPILKDGIWYKVCRNCKQLKPLSKRYYKCALCDDCYKTANYSANVAYRKRHIHVYIKERIRSGILGILKRHKTYKKGKTQELLGCDGKMLQQHLESKFQSGMTWDNHGQFGWHVDHIKPCASFDLTQLEEQKKCFHYTNLQPLWWQDNLAKADKIL
jgi:hypothetical protein